VDDEWDAQEARREADRQADVAAFEEDDVGAVGEEFEKTLDEATGDEEKVAEVEEGDGGVFDVIEDCEATVAAEFAGEDATHAHSPAAAGDDFAGGFPEFCVGPERDFGARVEFFKLGDDGGDGGDVSA